MRIMMPTLFSKNKTFFLFIIIGFAFGVDLDVIIGFETRYLGTKQEKMELKFDQNTSNLPV